MAAIALIAPGLVMTSIGAGLILLFLAFQLKGRKTDIVGA
jgi:hypothetical protein